MKRLMTVLLALALLVGGFAPAVSAEWNKDKVLSQFRYTDWVVSEDYSTITINSKTYPLYSILYRQDIGSYVFWHPWHLYLLSSYQQQQYDLEYFYENYAFRFFRETLHYIVSNFPMMEVILINGRPWQETEWADEILALLPVEYHELAKDPTINGWLKEAALLDIPVEQLRAMPRAHIPVELQRCELYRTIDEFIADSADFSRGDKPKEHIVVSAEFFLDGASGSSVETNPGDADASPSQNLLLTNRVRMVMYLDNPQVHITNFVGTPYEYSGTRILDQPPIAPNGHTLIPVRAFAETFGISTEWRHEVRTAVLHSSRADIYLTLGYTVVTVVRHTGSGNVEEKVPIPEPVRIENGRTLIPVRFVAETLGFEVGWDGALRQVTIEGDVPLVD